MGSQQHDLLLPLWISDTYFGGSKKLVLSKAHKSTTEPNHMEMVDDLKFFNSYPWGTSSFNVTIRSLHVAFEHRCSKTSNNSHTYNIIGFPMPFMVFSIEDRLSHIEDMITVWRQRLMMIVTPHNSDREQFDFDVHGAYDDDGHKANFDDAK
ncbi:hypothetical protein FNV43_RR01212 [Rhamnella rubrinervis]|uniref:DUF1985 domain-containing protein n=1 Tax=Rhamnella rubrinervis TaxID=2594499 RepID=A0A8K0MSM7_9ROSA|nr:hypothetical protein FNV43_RR01212 [Rhamnella rubrinervis]